MRKILLSVFGLLIIILSYFVLKYIIDSNQKPNRESRKETKTAYVEKAQLSEIPIFLEVQGIVQAKHRLELFAEVQGVFRTTNKLFRVGQSYTAGETILFIDSEEFKSSVLSAKSNLLNQITAILPDLRLDYPEAFPRWEAYVKSYDINKKLNPLPEPVNDSDRFFITSRNIFSEYFTIKNLEERLAKFRISAPYHGVLTEALVSEGTLIRSGQKLGTFIKPGDYELELSVSQSFLSKLKPGSSVDVFDISGNQSYSGSVVRINSSVDQSTQTVSVFVALKDPALKEGMFVKAKIQAEAVANAIELPRQLLQNGNQIYIVKNGTLDLLKVNPIHYNEQTVILNQVPANTLYLTQSITGAYVGMQVNVEESKAKT
ncbi:MAG: HlyD family efflux transporter periplasmic adaptor subunit [Flavobacteriaceae bacterium]|nr:HlyD family efflux transporter periplasmic adaptor subunit [Flavobacteriaceae bacterium]